ncbi:putative membrane protein YphA (DoxX/SURF4 family) [Pararhizobium capsulatum DSM 1112]|uniref:Membrane protein YphA (DoxX/SURF4 family) n=1 Tax=Pararhizobium capsulatum DSM 1112 TaxID=1121113 RepID=A0ABU0C152_9HYPH|nr:DoxX family protein [Pararhizobium capsulatum]MDQ0323942.1 putative membrane protein YphA (DoxX/SURF4 family) [Pararhizobium capsulatum DSM 1112]
MTYQTHTDNRVKAGLAGIIATPVIRTVALLALCAAYIQGPLTKIFDFNGAMAEMDHFRLQPAAVFAVIVIVFELTASAMVISGVLRWAGALALSGFTLIATLIALRFWALAPGMERMMATNAFFEHLGLAGAFVFVAAFDLTKGAKRGAPTHPRGEALPRCASLFCSALGRA